MNTTKITKDQILSKFMGVNGKLKKLKATEKVTYKTMHKHIPGAGIVSELDTEKGCVLAHSHVHREIQSLTSSAEALGVKLNPKDYMFQGFTLAVWNEEITSRLEEIRNANQIKALEKAKKQLEKHLSEEDLFNYDMAKLGLDLSDIEDYSDEAFDNLDEIELED